MISAASLAAVAVAAPVPTPASAAASSIAPVAAIVAAAPPMTAAAAARAKKLAAGGMDFVERPGQVYVPSSARNLAPPPVPASSPSAAAVPSLPLPPSFSFLRWYCTGRGQWVWAVRGLSVATFLALAYVGFHYYQAWRAKMERRLAAWREKDKLKLLESSSASSSSSSTQLATSTDASSSAPSGTSSVDSIGSIQFQSLTTLISARYQQLQSLHPALTARAQQQQQASTSSSQTENERDVANVTDAPVSSPTRQFAFMMDLLETTLKENEYYRDLLTRIRTQMKK